GGRALAGAPAWQGGKSRGRRPCGADKGGDRIPFREDLQWRPNCVFFPLLPKHPAPSRLRPRSACVWGIYCRWWPWPIATIISGYEISSTMRSLLRAISTKFCGRFAVTGHPPNGRDKETRRRKSAEPFVCATNCLFLHVSWSYFLLREVLQQIRFAKLAQVHLPANLAFE